MIEKSNSTSLALALIAILGQPPSLVFHPLDVFRDSSIKRLISSQFHLLNKLASANLFAKTGFILGGAY